MSHDTEQATARERILGIAGDLFAERGFDAVSVADIASASGISTGLIYYHFKDKQTLFETVVRESIHLLEDAAVVSLSGQTAPEVRLTSFVTAYMKLLEEHESLMRLLIRSMSNLGSPLPRHVLMRSSAIVDRLQVVIEEGIASGVFRRVDPRLAATALFALINTLITARVLDTPLGEQAETGIEAQAAFMSELFMGGIRSCS